ncbi:unnamed protein product [Penicillium salamii]|nr:unnamed protein product [Penicillium salamii]
MSSIIHKVKDAVTHKKSGDHTDHHDTTTESNQSTNHGPHDSNVANTADPRVDSDRSAHNTTSTGHTSEPFSTGASHESGLSSNHGPHDSNVANAADPRVDSDRSAHNTTSTGHSGPLGTGSSTNAYESSRSSNHGPHDSNIANTADPRVDSDRSAYNTTSTGHSSTGGLGSGAGIGAGAGAYESSRSSNHGPHDSNIANTADPRVDSDRSAYNTTSTGHSSTGGLGSGAGIGSGAGAYESGRSSNHGPHDSNIANTADPRVDSDRSAYNTSTGHPSTGHSSIGHSSTGHSTGHSTGALGAGAGLGAAAGAAGAYGASHSSNHSSNHGPHDSNIANTADPRVDSDRSSYGTGSTGLNTGSHTGSTGYGSSNPLSGTHDSSRSSNYGPHDSNVGNSVDPRVDSDLSSRTGSTGTGLNTGSHTGSHTGASYGSAAPLTGAGNSANAQESARSTNHGPHDSNIANAADPRVDSDRSKGYDFNNDVRKGSLAGQAEMMHLSDSSNAPNTTTRTFEEAHETGAAGTAAAGHGAGSSYNHGRTSHSTAGPHDSNIANKVDPRVDSDLDGSKTVGNTHQQRI